jgi:hypothetical protein
MILIEIFNALLTKDRGRLLLGPLGPAIFKPAVSWGSAFLCLFFSFFEQLFWALYLFIYLFVSPNDS